MACLSEGDYHKRGGEGKANKRMREKEKGIRSRRQRT